jgi:predicted porin
MPKSRNETKSEFRVAVICALLGGASGFAHAQSAVTLYGIVDSDLLYTSRTADPKTGAGSAHQFSVDDGGLSGSRFGMKGSEDLGGGMKAIFNLESGINTNNGGLGNSNGNLFGRLAYVGITGGMGTVKAGLQYSPFVLSVLSTDPRTVSYFGGGAVIYIGSLFTTALFNPNAISYTSPVIAGFEGSVMLALGGQAGDFQAGRQYSARLKYNWNSLQVDTALYSGNAGGTATSTPFPSTVPFSGRTIGAIYNWNTLTFRAAFINYKIAGSFDERVYTGGIKYAISPALAASAAVYVIRDGNDAANHSVLTSADLEYYISKRTTVYGQIGLVDNHGSMNIGLATNGALYEPSGTTTGVAIGIRHSF